MHPILFSIPLTWVTAIVVGLLMGVGAFVRHRYEAADMDSNYIASLLGLGVKWGVVRNPVGPSLIQGLMNGLIFAGLIGGAKYVVPRWFPEYTPEAGEPLALPLHIYGIMMATAFLVGIWLGQREAVHEQTPDVVYKENGKKVTVHAADLLSDLSFYLFISGLVGSRVLYIITRWDAEYAANPLRALNPVAGGLVWYGGLLGATATAFWFVRKHNAPFLVFADLLAPGVSIAHGVGRLGCFAAGCCFGRVAPEGSWLAVHFPAGSPAAIEHWGDVLGKTQISKGVYPTQIMETTGELIIFCILLYLRSRKRFHGQVVLTYFLLYAILRTIMETFRGDSIRGEGVLFNLSTSQLVSVLVAIVGTIAMVVIARSRSGSGGSGSTNARAA